MRPFHYFILWFIILTTTVSQAAGFNPWEGPKPIVVLEKISWTLRVTDEKPAVTIYEDGTAIFQKQIEGNSRYRYFGRKLSDAELAGVKDQMKVLFEIQNLKPSYDLAYKIGGSNIYLKQGDQERVVVVDGFVGTRYFLDPKEDLAEQKDSTENKLVSLYRYLMHLPFSEDKEWVPKFIELALFPSPTSTKPIVPWPQEWPGLHSDRALKLDSVNFIFMNGNQREELDTFFKQNRNSRFSIDGSPFSIGSRPVFPNEAVWRDAFKAHKKIASNP